ncbi:MAG: argininosuccinate lyase [Chthoniobacterales bacterium]
MWKGRFESETSRALEAFGESVSYDWRLFRQDVVGSIAHARALVKAGILTSEEFAVIEKGLREIEAEIEAGTFEFRVELEDIHMNIESALTERIGAAGAKLHTARSRNDQVATDFRLYLLEEGRRLGALIAGLQESLLGLAERSREILIPGYTHLQRAQPVTVAHHLLAYVEMLGRDGGRLCGALERCNFSPLGSGAIAGSTIALDRDSVAEELFFSGVTQNSMDAVADRDFACEFLSVAAILGMHLSRFCEDLILWSSAEFGFIRLSDAHTTGSSLMPQKKNPDIAELVRGKTGRLYGNLISLLTTMKGLPLTYNRDMQEDKEPVFDSIDTLKASLPLLAEMMGAAEVVEERCAAAVADPLLLATDLADFLVLEGVPFRKAHEMVGKMVAESARSGVALSELPQEIFESATGLQGEAWRSVFDLDVALRRRVTPGAPSFENTAARIEHWKRALRRG